MKRSTSFLIITAVIGAIATPSGFADPPQSNRSPISGTTPQQRKALAVVSVTRAALEIADDRPDLPDSVPPSTQSPEHDDTTAESPERPNDSLLCMRIELLKLAEMNDELPARLVVGHWVSGCPAGERQERDLRRILTPLGWKIGHSRTDHIQIVHISQDQTCPRTTLYQNGHVVKSWEGYQDPGVLSQELRRAWDSASDRMPTVSAAGRAGEIHAKAQIRQVLDWWRSSVGERTKVTFSWDRTGAQTFPLLAKGDWSAKALFGKSGRIEVSAIGASHLPVNSLGFGYRVIGDDFSIDLDPVTLNGLGARLNPTLQQSTQAGPSGIGPMTIWTIATVVRDLFALLHPTCDLQLGGNVSATAELSGNQLQIEFQQCPSIKLVTLFTFQLSVERVDINEDAVRLVFGGSRLVKERTFHVK